jgi:hypothetical protein
MSKIVFTLLMCLAFFAGYSAENDHNHNHNEAKCGTVTPSYAWEQSFQQQLAAFKASRSQDSRFADDSVTIPVIVHVCYYSATNPQPSNTSNNILGSQVASQFPVLNANFAGNSAFIGSIPSVFLPLKANTKIKWCPATMDPNGNILAEPGVDRVNTRTKGLPIPFPGGGATTNQWRRVYVEDTLKPATIWDPRYYCNIWIIPSFIPGPTGVVLAYASFPTTTTLDGLGGGTGYSYNDGVVCGKRFFGTSGQAQAPYNNGGTVCHELGHWLGLRHIWGDDSCGNDYVDDTPTQLEANTGTPTFPRVTCGNGPNGDMFMNYMDYVDDNVYNMFSLDQKDRMWTAMNNGQFRIPLKTSPTCNSVVPAPVANFIDSVKSQVLCSSKTIRFKDNSLFAITSPESATYTWSFPGGTPSSGTGKFVDVTYTSGGLKSVTLTITNSRGTNSITKNVSIPISADGGSLPFSEDFEGAFFPPVGWETVNRNGNQNIMWEGINGYSAYGNGIRCMKFDNTTLDAGFKRDDIMTSKINLTGVTQAKLKFDLSHAPYHNPTGVGIGLQQPDPKWIWDTLEVLITDNCQATAQSIYKKGDSALATVMPGQGEEFYPLPNQWRTDSVVIPAAYLNKPNVQIIFRNYGGYGHSIYVDNINITSPNSNPTATISLTSAAGTNTQSKCVGTAITNITYSVGSCGSGATATGLPTGVTGTFAGGVFTISGTPSVTGTFNYTVTTTGSSCTPVSASGTITVTPNATLSLSSAAGTNTQSKCVGTAITNITYAVGGGATSATATGLPTGVTGSFAGGVLTISGTPSVTGTFNYTVTTSGTCTQTNLSGTITVTPNATISLSSAAGTNTQTKCVGTAITNITYAVGGGGTSAGVTGLPTGVTGTFAGGVFTISGTPSVTGTFNYTVTTTGTCTQNSLSGSITVTPNATLSLSSAAGTNVQSKCVNTAITNITYAVGGGATSASATGLPTGVTGSFAGGVFTISGTPSVEGTFPYTVNTTGTCTQTSLSGTITVTNCGCANAPTVSLNGTSSNTCGTTAVTVAGNTFGGSATNVSLSENGAGSLNINSATTSPFSFTYTPASGDIGNTVTVTVTTNNPNGSPCVAGSTTYTINVRADGTVALTSTAGTNAQTKCVGTAITNITYAVGGSSTGGSVTGLPTGVTGSFAGGVVTISGTPSVTGTFNYTVNTSGSPCSNPSATGSITVSPNASIALTSASGTSGQTKCVDEAITNITYAVTNGTNASATGLPNGVTGSFAGGVFTISGAPTVGGTYNYTVNASGNCAGASATGSIVVNDVPPTPTITQNAGTDTIRTDDVGSTYTWYYNGSTTPIATTSVPYYEFATQTGSYTVKVTSGGCTSALSASFTPTPPTGIKNTTNSVKLFEVYPNPTEGRLVLNLNLYKTSSVNISIYTPEGREVYTKGYGNTKALTDELNVNELSKGVYIIKLRVDEEIYYHKVVKN